MQARQNSKVRKACVKRRGFSVKWHGMLWVFTKSKSTARQRAIRRMGSDVQSLVTDIVRLQACGLVPQQFRAADLAMHLRRRYTKVYISATLSTYACDSEGVRKRRGQPRFHRLGKGLYELLRADEAVREMPPAACL